MDTSYILNHLGEERENYYNAVSPPVFQTSNFRFKDVAALRLAFTNEKKYHIYSRGNNPTVEILRKKIAALAGADDALVFASGAAAVAAAVIANVKAGEHVVCVQKPYSWTHKLLNEFLARFGVQSTMVDGTNTQNFADALQPSTRIIFLESPNTFTFELQNIEELVKLAKQYNIITIIDNSYCTSLGQRCIEMGIDIEIHSASKHYGGHSDVVAGYLLCNQPMADKIFASEYLNLGANISPHDAWLLIRSLRTLPIRLEKIKNTTDKIVEWLETHPQIEKVIYPFSKSFPQYDLAKQQMLWCGGLFSVQLKVKNVEEVEKFCNALKQFMLAVSWGGYESLVVPACSFNPRRQYDDAAFPFNLIRFYIGLDDVEILMQDLKQAFAKIE